MMSRSSRHKQQRHSSRDGRERSDSEEDWNTKSRIGGEERMVRVTRDSILGEKRRIVSQMEDGNAEANLTVSDKWEEFEDERWKRDKVDGFRSEMKGFVDSKSMKFSRRNEGFTVDKYEGFERGSREMGRSGSSKVEYKYKSEMDWKESEVDRDRRIQVLKRERSVDPVPHRVNEAKEGSGRGHMKQEFESDEWQLQDDLRHPEPQKFIERRNRIRENVSGEQDKYRDDVRDGYAKKLSLWEDNLKDGHYIDIYQEDVNSSYIHRDYKHRDEHSSRDHTVERSRATHFRDGSMMKENQNKKSRPGNSGHDGNMHLDDRSSRYKDNKDRMMSSKYNDDHSDLKSLCTPDRCSDIERKPLNSNPSSSRAETRRSQSRSGDLDFTASSSKWKTSPQSSPHVTKDLHRTFEARSLEKPIQKDEKYSLDLSKERFRRSDEQASPMRLIEKSASSNIGPRYFNRSSLGRNIDQMEGRSDGSKDPRDYFANEDRRKRVLPPGKSSADDFSQADGDRLPVSSSFNKTCHLSRNPSILPPPVAPRRYDPNVGMGPGNAWGGVPRWPSPVPNGGFPYPHGPSPIGFHPMMPQFPSHLFQPSMDFNHAGLAYHTPDAGNFPSHGHFYGWQNPPGAHPLPHGWNGNHWDQNRHLMSSGRELDACTEMWKGQNTGVKMESSPPPAQKENLLQRVTSDGVSPQQSDQQLRNEHSDAGALAENIGIIQSSTLPPENESTEATTRTCKGADYVSHLPHAYLSKLDISEDLTHPELFDHCMSLLAEDDAYKVVEHDYTEEQKEAEIKISKLTENFSFFPKVNESIFERAMSLYKKQRTEVKIKHSISPFSEPKQEEKPLSTEEMKLEPVPTTSEIREPSLGLDCENHDPVSVSPSDNLAVQIPVFSEENTEDPVPKITQEMVEIVPLSDLEITETCPTSNQSEAKDETSTHYQNPEITMPSEVKEVETDRTPSLKELEPESEKVEEVEDNSVLEQALLLTLDLPNTKEHGSEDTDSRPGHGSEEPKMSVIIDGISGSVVFSNGSSEVRESVTMQESIEYRSRIHNISYNTH